MIWAFDLYSKFINKIWSWVERLFYWRPAPKKRTYKGAPPQLDFEAPFGMRNFRTISTNLGENEYEHQYELFSMQSRLNANKLSSDEAELLYMCRRIEKIEDYVQLVFMFFREKNMKRCRHFFKEKEYKHVNGRFVSITEFLLYNLGTFDNFQKHTLCMIDYNYLERRIYTPEEEALFQELRRHSSRPREIINILNDYYIANRGWYYHITPLQITTQEMMDRVRANYIRQVRQRSQLTRENTMKISTPKTINLNDIIKRLDEIEKFIGLKRPTGEMSKENGEIILD